MKLKSLSLIVVIIICDCISFYIQVISSTFVVTQLERPLKAFDAPGITVAIVKDAKIILAKGYGELSLNTMQKV